jgi:ABC-2 type transport system permease protein
LSHREFFAAYLLAAMARGLICGAGVLAATVWFVALRFAHPGWIVVFALLGAAIMGVLGIIAGIQSDKVDQLSAFQNFIILPLTFLSGVFYSIHTLPPFWLAFTHLNPFFYIVDGFRYGFFGVGDVSPWMSASIVAAALLALSWLALWMIQTGYKLRH